MKEVLFQAVRAAMRNVTIPAEWEDALVKFLSNKAGEEGPLWPRTYQAHLFYANRSEMTLQM